MPHEPAPAEPATPGLLLLAPLCLYALLRTPFTPAEGEVLARAAQSTPAQVLIGQASLYHLGLRAWNCVASHPAWLRLLSALPALAALFLARRVLRGI
ncbi:MAG: hypothetical protein AB1505_32585, partial [Candidatus Latescibacterota bacterium]